MRPDKLYLADIVEAADNIKLVIAGLDKDTFLSTLVVRTSAQYHLIVIGEAVTHLSKEFRESHPAVPWRDIASFRNFAVHEYFAVKWDIVWDAASVEVPELARNVAEILAKEFPS